MITNLFKKARIKYIKSNDVSRYLRYSLGEVLLITIGVLLAIQANNWNESIKKNTKIDDTYSRVFSDIDRNISKAEQLLSEYREFEYLYKKVLNDSIRPSHLDEGLAS